MLIFNNYSYFLHTIPFFVYLFYIVLRDSDHPLVDKILKIGLKGLGIYLFYFIYNYIQGTSLNKLIPFKWSYPAPIIWGCFFFIYYYILRQKEEKIITSITLAILATFGGGWLYEVSFFHPVSMFLGKGSFFYVNIRFICLILLYVEVMIKQLKPRPILLFIFFTSSILLGFNVPYPNGQIICLLLLAYELIKRDFKPNRVIYIAFLFFMIFSMMLFTDRLYMHQLTRDIFKSLNIKWLYIHAQYLKWIYRIPASIFLLSLLTGIRKKRMERYGC